MRFGLLRISQNLRQFVNFNGESSNYLEYLYYVYRTDPNHLQKSWQNYFSFLEQGKNYPVHHFDRNVIFKNVPLFSNQATSQASELISKVAEGVAGPEVLKLNELASAYRTYGHLVSTVDPLDLPKRIPFFRTVEGMEERLDIKNYKLTAEELSKTVPNLGLGGIFNAEGTVQSQIDKLKERYCGNISFEFGHISDSQAVAFLIDQIESENFWNLSKEESLACFKSICRAVKFEQFCAKAFPTLKRFGMDGIESLLVLLESIEKSSREFGANSILMTMSHRGRLGVLSNFLNKPLEESFAEFRGANWFVDSNFRSGDVKYHNGYTCVKNGLDIQMISNSSHLQFSHPVLTGLVKAKQHFEQDVKKEKTVPVAIHGNSAISGQGMPYEVVQMSKIKGFTVGGTINIVVNNQIGFTASPMEASSSRYPTDVAKVVEAPVIHVNAYSIEGVVFAGKLACLYRQKFHTDVFINLVGFRRFGHNELDMPKFTNAEMYHKVDQVPNLMVYYKNYLNTKMGIDIEELDKIENATGSDFQKSLELSKSIDRIKEPIQNENWRSILGLIEGFYVDNSLHNRVMQRIAASKKGSKGASLAAADNGKQLTLNPEVLRTGLGRDLLLKLGLKCTTIPEEIKLHNSIKKIFDQRLQALNSGTGIDTAISEVLAFSSLSHDGFHVRLSGQESKRGTFSHRHAQVQCQNTFKYYNVFDGMDVRILNSYLSELAAVGFEYGYSLYSPKTLNIWEAQFGDFVNGAQVIIDSFITSAETKWNYFSGVVMFLPHGYDGQGPDHSSCRVERFLQSSNDSEDLSDNLGLGEDYAKLVNISVVNCSIASNLFHVLRRQMHRPYRKPLICVTGKKLLKLRGAFSNLSEFETGTFFQRYIPDPLFNPNIMDHLYKGAPGAGKASGGGKVDSKQLDKVEKVILCSGQIYYDLLEFRENNKEAQKNLEKVAIARLEEITPFPAQWVLDDLRLYRNLKTVVWCQEEHENGGCYYFVRERLNNLLKILRESYGSKVDAAVKYAGRLPCATTAVGDPKTHNDEHALVEGAFYI
ncbi:2-oxoglutarate dehydrogenase E1 component [Theileria orientalis]|uniref:2-oxoglutarate dehydrogenase, mitochondrial n=1 Tax=Theileria orientalis TaxID=68886 RepID=A0A976M652_THEOR|nr:2-oxoglutarate dehydrogenase E1 component [Theileria orientalis]